MLWKSKYDLKKFQKNLHNTIFFKYKTVLCKFSWTTSKIRAMENRAIENHVRRGMPVCFYFFACKKNPCVFVFWQKVKMKKKWHPYVHPKSKLAYLLGKIVYFSKVPQNWIKIWTWFVQTSKHKSFNTCKNILFRCRFVFYKGSIGSAVKKVL